VRGIRGSKGKGTGEFPPPNAWQDVCPETYSSPEKVSHRGERGLGSENRPLKIPSEGTKDRACHRSAEGFQIQKRILLTRKLTNRRREEAKKNIAEKRIRRKIDIITCYRMKRLL